MPGSLPATLSRSSRLSAWWWTGLSAHSKMVVGRRPQGPTPLLVSSLRHSLAQIKSWHMPSQCVNWTVRPTAGDRGAYVGLGLEGGVPGPGWTRPLQHLRAATLLRLHPECCRGRTAGEHAGGPPRGPGTVASTPPGPSAPPAASRLPPRSSWRLECEGSLSILPG